MKREGSRFQNKWRRLASQTPGSKTESARAAVGSQELVAACQKRQGRSTQQEQNAAGLWYFGAGRIYAITFTEGRANCSSKEPSMSQLMQNIYSVNV